MTTATTQRPSTNQAMQSAALNGNAARPSNGCKDCNKVGLAILPVVAMPVPAALRGTTAELKALDSHYIADDLKSHWMVLRTLPSGYLYVMKPDLSWDIYVVDREGLLRLAPSLSACPVSPSDQKPMSEQCKRSGDNIPAQVIAVDPSKHASVWLAFSRHRWTADVLKAYAANKDGCRNKRMTKLDVMAAANGSLGTGSKANNAVQFGVPMSPNIGQVVADYASQPTRDAINGHSLEPIQARGDQSAQLAQAMAKISINTAGKTGAVIVLPDDLGVAQALNAARNAAQVERSAVIKEYLRYDFVHRAAAGFKQQCEKQGDIKRWNELYSKAYKQAEIDNKFKERDKKLKPIDTRLNAMGDDWAKWMQRPGLCSLFAHDFDAANLCEGMRAAVAGAACLHGAGTQTAERSLIQSWIQGDIKDEGNILWQALSGNHKGLLTRLGDVKDLMPAGLDTLKNFWGGADEFEKSLSKEEGALLMRLRDGSKDPIGAAVAKLLHVIASCLDPAVSSMGKAGARAILITALWSGLRVAPMRHSVTPQQAAIDAKVAGWGAPAGAKVQTVRKGTTTSWRYNLLEATDVLAAKGGIAIVQTRFVVLQIWKKSGWINVGEPTTVPSPRPTTTPAPAIPSTTVSGKSVWRRLGGVLREGGANAVLASGVLCFQVLSFNQVSKDLQGGGSADKGIELTASYFAALAGMMGAASEITAASIQLTSHIRGVDLAKTAPRMAGFVRGAAAVGGLLGGVSGLAMALASGMKAASLSDAGDLDAANWTYGLSAVSMVGSVTGGLGALTASGAAAGGSSLVGGTLLGIGPAGWAILTVGAVAIGVYLAYKAAETTDDPIEAWLKQSIAGTAPSKYDPATEVESYNNLFQLPLEVEASGTTLMGKHSAVIRITAAALDAQSQIEYALDVVDAEGKVHPVFGKLTLKSGALTSSIATTIRPHSMGAISAFESHQKTELSSSLRIAIVGQFIPAGWRDPKTGAILRTAKHAIKTIRVNVKYRPIPQTDGDWVLPSPSGHEMTHTPAR